MLLERDNLLDLLASAAAEAGAGHGRLVLLGGEAGAGKTALLRTFTEERAGGAHILRGACERLFTPRALGPFLDVAEASGGELAEAVTRGTTPAGLLAPLVAELRRGEPTVLAIEDLHWADEGTLDLLKLLARRVEGLPALVVATFRDDAVRPGEPLRMLLGELAGHPAVERHHLPPLTFGAVRRLAASSGTDATRLFEKTGGNPFFVTEALATPDAPVPDTVRDAVLARAAGLPASARRLLDAAAVVPSRVELWLLEAVAGDDRGCLDACLTSGMVRHEDGVVAFRHELARLAIEEAIAPQRRRELHRAVLDALRSAAPGSVDPARLAHHADAAGDAEAVLRFAPEAAERAAAYGAHHEAARHLGRALRHAGVLDLDRRAELLERRSYECYVTERIDDAAEARRAALALHRERGDRLREGDSHRWLSRLAWFAGDNATAVHEAQLALELLEPLPPGRELAMAHSNAAQLAMLSRDAVLTERHGRRAIELAEQLGETETLAHALNNVGTSELIRGDRAGAAKLERSLALALDADLPEHVARAYTNLASIAVDDHDPSAGDLLEAGLAYACDRDLDAWWLYLRGWQARWHLDAGRWDAAGERAATVLQRPGVAVPSRIMPLVVTGRLLARRGQAEPWAVLDEARELAGRTAELQRLAPVAAARAEARWLAGDLGAIAGETEEVVALARRRDDARGLAELLVWRRRAGVREPDGGDSVRGPHALEVGGDPLGAARQWDALGCPYEAAMARAQSRDIGALRQALDAFERLGADAAARAVRRRLRQHGVRPAARGPRRTTRENPAQLTARQLEILELLGDRLTNAEIAGRLFLSQRTVDHHVSAILGKLGVRSRADAAAEAERLGVLCG